MRVSVRGPFGARVVIEPARAPFALTSYARARLLRQLHACGLLRPDADDCPRDR